MNDLEAEELARKVGTWSSLAAAVATATSMVPLAVSQPWTDMAAYAAAFNDSKLIMFVCWLLLAVFFVVAVASVHSLGPDGGKLLSSLSLAFAAMYATIVSVVYVLQFIFVRQRILAGDLSGLEPWVAGNPNSAVFATDILGYLFQGISTLFLAPLFRGGRLLNAIKWLFVVNGILGIGGIVGISVTSAGSAGGQAFGVAGLLVWASLLSIALFLLAVAFRGRLLPGFHESKRERAAA